MGNLGPMEFLEMFIDYLIQMTERRRRDEQKLLKEEMEAEALENDIKALEIELQNANQLCSSYFQMIYPDAYFYERLCLYIDSKTPIDDKILEELGSLGLSKTGQDVIKKSQEQHGYIDDKSFYEIIKHYAPETDAQLTIKNYIDNLTEIDTSVSARTFLDGIYERFDESADAKIARQHTLNKDLFEIEHADWVQMGPFRMKQILEAHYDKNSYYLMTQHPKALNDGKRDIVVPNYFKNNKLNKVYNLEEMNKATIANLHQTEDMRKMNEIVERSKNFDMIKTIEFDRELNKVIDKCMEKNHLDKTLNAEEYAERKNALFSAVKEVSGKTGKELGCWDFSRSESMLEDNNIKIDGLKADNLLYDVKGNRYYLANTDIAFSEGNTIKILQNIEEKNEKFINIQTDNGDILINIDEKTKPEILKDDFETINKKIDADIKFLTKDTNNTEFAYNAMAMNLKFLDSRGVYGKVLIQKINNIDNGVTLNKILKKGNIKIDEQQLQECSIVTEQFNSCLKNPEAFNHLINEQEKAEISNEEIQIEIN